MNRGLERNVAAAIVVPTKAATIIRPPGTSGMLGISPLATSTGRGCTNTSETMNEIPMMLTKNTRTFSNREYRPISSIEYMTPMTTAAIAMTTPYLC